ncbi:hypothetical protein DIPPA_06724 [Diplonema papillatum]|nr:hypothetical protein DIPPA_06724 [Diplonema papillatum]
MPRRFELRDIGEWGDSRSRIFERQEALFRYLDTAAAKGARPLRPWSAETADNPLDRLRRGAVVSLFSDPKEQREAVLVPQMRFFLAASYEDVFRYLFDTADVDGDEVDYVINIDGSTETVQRDVCEDVELASVYEIIREGEPCRMYFDIEVEHDRVDVRTCESLQLSPSAPAGSSEPTDGRGGELGQTAASTAAAGESSRNNPQVASNTAASTAAAGESSRNPQVASNTAASTAAAGESSRNPQVASNTAASTAAAGESSRNNPQVASNTAASTAAAGESSRNNNPQAASNEDETGRGESPAAALPQGDGGPAAAGAERSATIAAAFEKEGVPYVPYHRGPVCPPACSLAFAGELCARTLLEELDAAMQKQYDLRVHREAVVKLTSRYPHKYSVHLIVHLGDAAFRSNQHMGRFLTAFVQDLCEKARADARLHRALFYHKLDDSAQAGGELLAAGFPRLGFGCLEGRGLALAEKIDARKKYCDRAARGALNFDRALTPVIDLGVYTRNRTFRCMSASKLGKRSHLRVDDADCDYPYFTDYQLFLASLVCNVPATGLRLLEYGVDAAKHKPNLPSAVGTGLARSSSSQASGAKDSPLPLLDGYVRGLLKAPPFKTGAVQKWIKYDTTMLYQVVGSRYCANVGREHRSNGVYLVVSFGRCSVKQKCHDPECQGYSSPEMYITDNAAVQAIRDMFDAAPPPPAVQPPGADAQPDATAPSVGSAFAASQPVSGPAQPPAGRPQQQQQQQPPAAASQARAFAPPAQPTSRVVSSGHNGVQHGSSCTLYPSSCPQQPPIGASQPLTFAPPAQPTSRVLSSGHTGVQHGSHAPHPPSGGPPPPAHAPSGRVLSAGRNGNQHGSYVPYPSSRPPPQQQQQQPFGDPRIGAPGGAEFGGGRPGAGQPAGPSAGASVFFVSPHTSLARQPAPLQPRAGAGAMRHGSSQLQRQPAPAAARPPGPSIADGNRAGQFVPKMQGPPSVGCSRGGNPTQHSSCPNAQGAGHRAEVVGSVREKVQQPSAAFNRQPGGSAANSERQPYSNLAGLAGGSGSRQPQPSSNASRPAHPNCQPQPGGQNARGISDCQPQPSPCFNGRGGTAPRQHQTAHNCQLLHSSSLAGAAAGSNHRSGPPVGVHERPAAGSTCQPQLRPGFNGQGGTPRQHQTAHNCQLLPSSSLAGAAAGLNHRSGPPAGVPERPAAGSTCQPQLRPGFNGQGGTPRQCPSARNFQPQPSSSSAGAAAGLGPAAGSICQPQLTPGFNGQAGRMPQQTARGYTTNEGQGAGRSHERPAGLHLRSGPPAGVHQRPAAGSICQPQLTPGCNGQAGRMPQQTARSSYTTNQGQGAGRSHGQPGSPARGCPGTPSPQAPAAGGLLSRAMPYSPQALLSGRQPPPAPPPADGAWAPAPLPPASPAADTRAAPADAGPALQVPAAPPRRLLAAGPKQPGAGSAGAQMPGQGLHDGRPAQACVAGERPAAGKRLLPNASGPAAKKVRLKISKPRVPATTVVP